MNKEIKIGDNKSIKIKTIFLLTITSDDKQSF
jgi:hypothetical protein